MTSSARAAPAAKKRPRKATAAAKVASQAVRKTAAVKASPRASASGKGGKASRSSSRKSPTSLAIATELAPAVAIALLDKAGLAPGEAPAALDCLAAGAGPSAEDGKLRVQLMFENGAVLPVEMSHDAGAALAKGLVKELAEETPAPPAKRRSGK